MTGHYTILKKKFFSVLCPFVHGMILKQYEIGTSGERPYSLNFKTNNLAFFLN